MPTSEFVIETDPTPQQVQHLEDRLYEFNSGATGITDGAGLAIFVRDERGRIIAGVCGNTWGGFCEIRQFWVNEPVNSARLTAGNRKFLTKRLWGVGNQSLYFHHGLFTTMRQSVQSAER